MLGYWREGWEYAQRALAREPEEIAPSLAAGLLNGAAGLARLIGEAAQAQALYERCLEIMRAQQDRAAMAQELGDWHGTAESLDTLAALFLEADQLRPAVRLYGMADDIRTQAKATRTPLDQQKHEEHIQELRERVTDTEFNAAWSGDPVEAKPWGMREFVVWDNNGFILYFGQDT